MMLISSTAWLLLGVQLSARGVLAHTNNFVLPTLSKCWQDCFAKTGSGCSTSSCICTTTADNESYLPSAVSCAVSKCAAKEWSLDMMLAPLEVYCAVIGSPVSDEVMQEAYAAAADDEPTPKPPTSPPAPPSQPKPSAPQTTTKVVAGTQDITRTIQSTFTRTTTEDGNTLAIIIPIVIGPSGIATGGASTSTITAKASATASSSHSAAAPSASVSSKSSTGAAAPATSATSSSRPTQRPASGNGSPFDNMQAGADRWSVSMPLLGLGFVALFLVGF